MEYAVYVYRSAPEVYETLCDRFGYEESVRSYLGGKSSESATDRVLRLAVLEHRKIVRRDFKKLRQALRHYDEIGLSNELVEIVEALEEEDVSALSLGQISAQEADLSVYQW